MKSHVFVGLPGEDSAARVCGGRRRKRAWTPAASETEDQAAMNKDYLNTVDEWITNYKDVYLGKIGRVVTCCPASVRDPMECVAPASARADAGCACLISANERSSL